MYVTMSKTGKITKYLKLITVFALLHVAVSVPCYIFGVNDTMLLTLLTMTLVVIICVKERLSVELTAINAVLVNILGYLFGMALASAIGVFISSVTIVHSISTFLTTECMGWCLVWFISLLRDNKEDKDEEETALSETQVKWLAISLGIVLALRIFINTLMNSSLFNDTGIMGVVSIFLSNTVVMLTLICITVIALRYSRSVKAKTGTAGAAAVTLVFIITVSALAAMIAVYGLPFKMEMNVTFREFLELFVVAIICETAIFTITYLVDYAVNARRIAEAERMRANVAKSQYFNLKQLVNPHFLFNSLNVLDYLVAEHNIDRSREYIRQLAGMFRYMLGNEEKPVSTLREEMEYASMYVELMKVRFPEGFLVEDTTRKEDYDRFVVTYSVQMLIENAFKHNAVSADRPLIIRISSDGNTVTVTNNLIPKLTARASTGIGLKYISRNYQDRCGHEVSATMTGTDYTVALPLL